MTITTICDELADAIFSQGYLVSHVEVKIETPYRSRNDRSQPGRGRIALTAEVTYEFSLGQGRELAPKSSNLCETSNPIDPTAKVRWVIGDCGPGIFNLVGLLAA